MDQAQGIAGDLFASSGPPPPAPSGPAGADIGISADGSQFYVQGQTFGSDDYDNAIRAEALIDQPGRGQLPAGFRRMSPENYRQFTGQIKNPSGWELFKRNFGTGVDVAQQNIGRAAQAFNEGLLGPLMPKGDVGYGADMAAANAEEIRKKSPYARSWDDSSTGDFIIGTLGQAVPSIVGSLGAAAAGGLVGGVPGAIAGGVAYNYPQAVGDIAQRQIDVSGRIDPGAAFGYAIPYAGLETAAEALPVAAVLGKLGKAGTVGLKTVTGRGFKSGATEVGKRLVVGAGAGAAGEGATEAGQQGFVRAGAGQELWSPEAQAEYLESARAGATVGAFFGSGARLFTRAPAQTGEELTSAPADLLNQPSQRMLPPPGPPNLPGGGATRPDFWGSNQTGRDVGPYYGRNENVVDAEWSEVPGQPGLPPAGPRGLPPGPGGPLALGGPAAPLQIAGPTDPDLFGGSRYTDPGTPPPTPPAGGGAGLSPAEFYNQTPMGQHIADQLIAEHTERAPAPPPPAPTSAKGGTMADMLATLTGRQTPDAAAAAEAARRGDVANEAIAAAGQQAYEELGYQGQDVGLTRGVADFRPKGLALLRGKAARAAAPTKAALKTEFDAIADTMDAVTRKRIKKQLGAPKLGEAKRAEIAAEIAKHTKALPASHQPAGTAPAESEMAFGTSGGVRLKRGAAKAAKAGKAALQAPAALGDRLYALRGSMTEAEFNTLQGKLRLAVSGNVKVLAEVRQQLDQIEAEFNANESPFPQGQVEEQTTPPGEARLRAPRGPAPALIEIGGADTFVSTTPPTSTPPYDAEAEAAILEDLDSLPDSADEYTVMAAHKYLDENRYDMAATFAKAARQGKAIGRIAMDQAAVDAQKAKINERREQKSADTDIEGGVDEAMAVLASAINDLGTARGKKKAYLTKEQVAALQGLIRGNSTAAQVRARTLAYLEVNGHTAEALRNAERARTNKQAEAEGKGETQPAPPPKKADPLDAAVEKLKAQWGIGDKKEVVTEAVAAATINLTDEEILGKLDKADRDTISDEYGDGLYSAKAKRAFLNAFRDTINKTAKGVPAAIKAIIKRISTGVMAMAMVFNPAALTNMSPDFLFARPAQAATINPVPAGIQMSDTAALGYTRLSGMAQGRVLIIVDKPDGNIHFFDKTGAPIASAPVLTGASKNDTLPQNVTEGGTFSTQDILNIPTEERVTPAGVFTTAKSKDGTFLWLNDAQGQSHQIAIHNTEIKSRLPRFTTSGAGDNMVSYGCVNISPEMYEATLKDNIDKFNNAVVFVVPHDLSKAEALLPEAEAMESQREAPPLRTPPREQAAEAPPLREEDYLDEPNQPSYEARPSPVFSREDTTAFVGDGMAQADVDAVLLDAVKGWKSPPEIHSHKDWASIPEQYKARVSKTSKGFFDRSTGAVHVIAGNVADAADVRSTLYHEALGHFGLWNRFTQRLGPMLVKMYKTNATVKAEADKYLNFRGLEATPANIAVAVEETLAEWFSPGAVKMSAWQQMAAYVRSMGRTIGLVTTFTNNDVVSIMHKAQQYTMRSDGPVTMMEHNEAAGPAVLMRDWTVAQTVSESPAWLRDTAQSRWTATRDAVSSGSFKVMLTNQLLDDWLPSLGATLAKRVAGLVRNRDAMTNGLMKGAREWAARLENQPLSFRGRSKGVGAPDISNFSGFVETSRRRGRWGFIPDDGRFPADDMDAVEERFRRGTFNAKHEQTAGPLIDPELEAAFNRFDSDQQQIVRDFYFELYNHRDNERRALFDALAKAYDGGIADANTKVEELEYELGIAQERAERDDAAPVDKNYAKKKAKEYAGAVAARDNIVNEKARAARELHNTYRDMEFTPYAPMQRHGAFVIVGESRALQAARAAARRAKEAGQEYKTPEGQPSIYAMEAMPEHYFVHAVDSRVDAVRMVTELKGDADFSGGRITYNKVADVGEELFKGSDVIAGLNKIMGNVGASGEMQATNNVILAIAKRTIIDAMSQNSAKKADLHFRNIRSAPLDMPKAFMSRMLSSSQFLSGHYHNADINRALADSQEQIKDRRYVSAQNYPKAMAGLNEFIGRYNDDMTPKSDDTMADVLTGMSSAWMLMMSPSYYAQQAAQNVLITAPYLSGRFNPAAVTKAFGVGYAQVNKALRETGGTDKSGVLSYLSNGMLDISAVDPKYREILRYVESMGLLDVSMNLEMGRVSSDITTGRWDKLKRGVRNSVRGLEAVNRIAAAVASYELMQGQGQVTAETISNLLGVDQKAFDQRYQDYLANHTTMAKYADQAKEPMPPVMSSDEFAAAEYARQVILDTHGDYSSSNKPVWTRRGLGRVATQFRTFNVMMIGTYAKTLKAAFNYDMTKEERAIARRTLMYMTANTALFAGVNGLPVAGLFGALYAFLLGSEDEPDKDYQKDLRDWIGDPTISNLLLYGAPSLVGLNVSGSMGMGNMFTMVPGKDAPTDKESATNWALALFGGPSSATGLRFIDAWDLWYNKGQTYKALQTAVPKFLQGPAQAVHDSLYGEFTRTGVQLMRPEDISIAEKAFGFFGFQSADRSARKWAIGRSIDEDQFFSSTGASIKRNFVEARAAGDSDGMAEARENWKALQASRQRFGLKQQPISQLSSAAKKMATDTKNVYGGVPYSGGNKGQALKLGQLAGQ